MNLRTPFLAKEKVMSEMGPVARRESQRARWITVRVCFARLPGFVEPLAVAVLVEVDTP